MAFSDKTPRRWILLPALLFNACGTQQAQLHQQQFLLVGTLVDISIWSTDKQKTEPEVLASIEARGDESMLTRYTDPWETV